MESRIMVLLAETPVHAGGSEAQGVVDLPIQRESTTGLPVIWGQSLKGALRQAARDARWEFDKERRVFGSRPPGFPGQDGIADGEGESNLLKGGVSFGDAQLVLFPVPTLRRAFGWVTAPLVLSRLRRRFALAGVTDQRTLVVMVPDGQVAGTAAWQGVQVLGSVRCNVSGIEDMARVGEVLATLVCPEGEEFYYTRAKLGEDVLAVDDATLCAMAETGTEVTARVQLNPESKTVANGPFYTENLPAETVLMSVLTGPTADLDALSELLDGTAIQLGGDETLGKGVLWCRVHATAALSAATAGAAEGSR
jgi:CRISPR-associated protein Cmr4